MLRKLLKYELFATARQFLPLYGALLIISLFNKLLWGGNAFYDSDSAGMTAMIGMMVYMCLIVAIFVITLIVMIQRFYKNLLSDEGYLMFTLPVKSWQLISSKLLISMFWIVASMVVLFFSIFLMVMNREILSSMLMAFDYMLDWINQNIEISHISLFIQLILAMFFETVSGVLMIYASISLGHLIGKHRMLAAFGAFIGLNVVRDIVPGLFGSFFAATNAEVATFNGLEMLPALLFSIACSAAFFAITNYVLTRKLNLE